VVGQARSITAVVSVIAALLIVSHADSVGVRRLMTLGALLTFAACGLVATAETVPFFLAVHVLVGLAFAVLLSSGFAGLAAFPTDRRAAATGLVAGANALAWAAVNPLAAALTEWWSWRAAQAVPAAIGLATLATAHRVVEIPHGAVRPSVWTPLRVPAARRWIFAEIAAYAAWASLLTFAGAFFIERLEVRESVTGWLLAAGAAAYFAAATRSAQLAERVPTPRLVAGSALAMAVLSVVMLTLSASVATATGVFCLIGLMAGIRTPASAGLALDQLPGQPGAMMAARTAATQLGYLVGAALGGCVIAGPGFPMLGLALAASLTVSAWLVLTLHDSRTSGPIPAPTTPIAASQPTSRASAPLDER
jgi:predicted MFS family arabinose efflux permease